MIHFHEYNIQLRVERRNEHSCNLWPRNYFNLLIANISAHSIFNSYLEKIAIVIRFYNV